MAEETAKVVADEQPTAAEKEEKVLESAGVDTKADEGVYKVDLREPQKTEENAVQEQSADEVPVRDESDTSEKVEEDVRDTEESIEQEEETV